MQPSWTPASFYILPPSLSRELEQGGQVLGRFAACTLEINGPVGGRSRSQTSRAGANGITATAFGELLCSHARLIKEELEFAETQIQNPGKRRARVMTVGTLPSLAARVVPLAVSRWRELHPRIVLRVVEKVQVELLFGLLRGDFDFIIAQTEFYDILDGLRQRVIFRDRLRVFARPKHRLFRLASPNGRTSPSFRGFVPWWAEGSVRFWRSFSPLRVLISLSN